MKRFMFTGTPSGCETKYQCNKGIIVYDILFCNCSFLGVYHVKCQQDFSEIFLGVPVCEQNQGNFPHVKKTSHNLCKIMVDQTTFHEKTKRMKRCSAW